MIIKVLSRTWSELRFIKLILIFISCMGWSVDQGQNDGFTFVPVNLQSTQAAGEAVNVRIWR